VTLIALLTDAVVDGDIDLGVQLKGEDARGRERVARLPLTPYIPSPTTPKHRTVVLLRTHSSSARSRAVVILTAEVEDG
jgi:hypothetical protein